MGKQFALGMILGWMVAAPAWSQQSDFEEQGQKFNTLLYYMDQLYVEDTDMESLVETAIVNMLQSSSRAEHPPKLGKFLRVADRMKRWRQTQIEWHACKRQRVDKS